MLVYYTTEVANKLAARLVVTADYGPLYHQGRIADPKKRKSMFLTIKYYQRQIGKVNRLWGSMFLWRNQP